MIESQVMLLKREETRQLLSSYKEMEAAYDEVYQGYVEYRRGFVEASKRILRLRQEQTDLRIKIGELERELANLRGLVKS